MRNNNKTLTIRKNSNDAFKQNAAKIIVKLLSLYLLLKSKYSISKMDIYKISIYLTTINLYLTNKLFPLLATHKQQVNNALKFGIFILIPNLVLGYLSHIEKKKKFKVNSKNVYNLLISGSKNHIASMYLSTKFPRSFIYANSILSMTMKTDSYIDILYNQIQTIITNICLIIAFSLLNETVTTTKNAIVKVIDFLFNDINIDMTINNQIKEIEYKSLITP